MPGPDRSGQYWGHTSPWSPQEIVERGEVTKVPVISVETGVGDCLRVIYHHDHGDTIIYPTHH